MPDNLNYQQVQDYLTSLVPARPDEMQLMEHYAREHDFPIIGPVAGYYCYQVTRMAGALSVFEMGSGYGYSTAWFALAVKETQAERPGSTGVVHHVVWDQQLSQMARTHLDNLQLGALVQFHVAEAVQTLKTRDEKFDLIFCDINKDTYPAALEVINQKTHPGSILIIDNMLWSGRIFDASDQSPATAGVREFTRRITADRNWIVSLAPLRDGLIVAYKKT
ncbi:MAG TPA: class I SAM-dependent methyltransferase [Anaerolineales bacterium]|jgi:predicted O-methyltransferase YrrM